MSIGCSPTSGKAVSHRFGAHDRLQRFEERETDQGNPGRTRGGVPPRRADGVGRATYRDGSRPGTAVRAYRLHWGGSKASARGCVSVARGARVREWIQQGHSRSALCMLWLNQGKIRLRHGYSWPDLPIRIKCPEAHGPQGGPRETTRRFVKAVTLTGTDRSSVAKAGACVACMEGPELVGFWSQRRFRDNLTTGRSRAARLCQATRAERLL
jgi:hypothetical protein